MKAARGSFSLQSLLDLGQQAAQGGTESKHAVGRFLLQCVADRLAHQEHRLKEWTARLEQNNPNSSSIVNDNTKQQHSKVIRTAQYHQPLG